VQAQKATEAIEAQVIEKASVDIEMRERDLCA
jgi:hypothetical protein